MPTSQEPQRRVRFDGTINLGHIITVITFIGAGTAAWSSMDKRVAILEEARTVQRQVDARQDEDRAEIKKAFKEDMREILRKVDILVERRAP